MTTCNDARPMIPSYLDGELTEAQAAPLRKHLLECQPCRASAQDQKNVTRWFQVAKSAEAAVPVPRDFAARVARRAFQGDSGTLTSAPALPTVVKERSEARHLRLVLTLTAAAAAVVLIVSMAIRQMTLPSSQDLRADDKKDVVVPLPEAIQELDRLNARERDAAGGLEAKPRVETKTPAEHRQ